MRKFNVAEEKQKGIVGKVLSVWIEGVGGVLEVGRMAGGHRLHIYWWVGWSGSQRMTRYS